MKFDFWNRNHIKFDWLTEERRESYATVLWGGYRNRILHVRRLEMDPKFGSCCVPSKHGETIFSQNVFNAYICVAICVTSACTEWRVLSSWARKRFSFCRIQLNILFQKFEWKITSPQRATDAKLTPQTPYWTPQTHNIIPFDEQLRQQSNNDFTRNFF